MQTVWIHVTNDAVMCRQVGDFCKPNSNVFAIVIFIAPLWKSLSFCHSVIIQMKLEYLWGQLANLDQILCEASLGWGKGCIRFWNRLGQNSGFHGNRKRPLTYNWGKRCLHLFFVVFYQIFFKLAGNEDRHKISDKFEFRPDQITPYRVRCPWAPEKFPIDLWWENGVSKLARSFCIRSLSNLLVTRTGIKSRMSSNSGQIGSIT